MDDSDSASQPPIEPSLHRPHHPAAIGHYRITGVLGEGGMGTVYEAEQDQPHRLVALKVIRPEFVQPDLIRRFERESEVLGRLQHPGIAQIYEAGTFVDAHGTQPFFAMELINGQTLTDYARTQNLDLKRRLELFARVCDAVNYAHQQGVIHRDLKPANIMVESGGLPKILDFGVARLTDADVQATRQTSVGEVIGTLQYMSPEQINAAPDDVDRRSDVYSLGVILYELLSGKLPYDLAKKLIYEAARIVLVDDPMPLSSVNRTLKGDVEVIVSKALEKEKTRRYASAEELASDVRRFLTDEPIAARPASAFYQLGKFARRNRTLVTGIGVAVLMLVAGTVVSTWQALRATAAERSAEARRVEAVAAGLLAESRRAEADSALRVADSSRVVADSARLVATREQAAATASAAVALSEAAKAEAVNTFLQTMLASSDPANALGKELTVRELLDQAAKRMDDGDLAAQPDVRAGVETMIGRTYFALGLYDQSSSHLDSAYAIRRRTGGSRSLDAGMTAADLGELRRASGDYTVAADKLTEAIATLRARLRPDDDRITAALTSLANVRYQQANNVEAERLHREALRLSRSRHGNTGVEVALRLRNLGSFLTYTGDPEKGLPMLQESLRLLRGTLGNLHPQVVDGLVSLSDANTILRHFPEAESELSEALPFARTLHGTSHPSIADILSRLGTVLGNQGKLAQAEPMNREALAMRISLLGAQHPDVQLARVNLGRILQSQGRYVEAESLFTAALEARRAELGATSPAVAASLQDLGYLAKVREQWSTAEQRYREAIPIWKAAGVDQEEVNSLAEVGFAMGKQKRFDEAEPILNDVIARRKARFGDENFAVGDAYEKLALIVAGKGDLARAELLSVEGLRIRRAVYGERSIQVAFQLPNVAFAREAIKDTSSAIAPLREAVSILKGFRPANDPFLVSVQRMLAVDLCSTGAMAEGDSLLQAAVNNAPVDPTATMPYRLRASQGFCRMREGKYAEAEPLLLQAESGLGAISGAAAHRLLVINWLVSLYDGWSKPAEAAIWRERAKEEK